MVLPFVRIYLCSSTTDWLMISSSYRAVTYYYLPGINWYVKKYLYQLYIPQYVWKHSLLHIYITNACSDRTGLTRTCQSCMITNICIVRHFHVRHACPFSFKPFKSYQRHLIIVGICKEQTNLVIPFQPISLKVVSPLLITLDLK